MWVKGCFARIGDFLLAGCFEKIGFVEKHWGIGVKMGAEVLITDR